MHLQKGVILTRVFVASSGDLAEERKELSLLLYTANLKPVLWEATDRSITKETFQDRLNKEELSSSKIVIFMVRSRFGKYTKKEFDFAYDMIGHGIERIYVYFFSVDANDLDDDNWEAISSFKKDLKQNKEVLTIKVKNYTELANSILVQKEFWKKDNKQTLHKEDTQEEEKQQEALKKFLIKENDTSLLQKKFLKYHPSQQMEAPESIEEMFDKLVDYGKSLGSECVPLLCVLNELLKSYDYELVIKNYIEYLQDKYSTSGCGCNKNSESEDMHLGIEFFDDSDEKSDKDYSIVLWKYSLNRYQKSNLKYSKSVDIEDEESIVALFSFLDDKLRRYARLYIEIILPLDMYEVLYVKDNTKSKRVKEWYTIRGRRKKRVTIPTIYRLIYRIQDRFREPDQKTWKEGWDSIDMQKSLLENTSGVISREDELCLSTNSNCLIANHTVENIIEILDEIEDHEISIALLNLKDEDGLLQTKMESLKEEVSKSIMSIFASKKNTDILFLLDNPNHRPDYVTSNNHQYSI